MKLIQLFEKYLERVGIIAENRLNGKMVMAFTSFWLTNILNSIFIVLEVNSFSELANSLFVLSETITMAICYTILIIRTEKLFNIIGTADQFIDQGEFQIVKTPSQSL